MAALGKVIERAAQFMRRERRGKPAIAQGVRVGGHDPCPLRRSESGQQAVRGEQFVVRASALASPAQLPAHHALGASLLLERRAVDIARLGEDAGAQALDLPAPARFVEIDDREADRGRADVETENPHGRSLPKDCFLWSAAYTYICSETRGGRFSQAKRPFARAGRPKVNSAHSIDARPDPAGVRVLSPASPDPR
jgi:hypothetical protein